MKDISQIITKIQAEEQAEKAHDIRIAYLAGYITKREMDDMLFRLGMTA